MARNAVEDGIDRLYQLPLGDFTRERNAIAKELSGGDAKRVRALAKPSTGAWAVNQLYWHDRNTYDTLVESSERLRAAHRAVLGGRKADLRQADADHRAAVKAALTATLRIVSEQGQSVSSATHTEIVQTLERLPSEDAPGRLTKALKAEGFEALQGMPIRAPALRLVPPPARKSAAADVGKDVDEDVQEDAASRTRARQEAARARKEAQRALQAAREKEKRARAEVARLQKQVAAAEREAAAARQAWEQAHEAERKAQTALREASDVLEQSVTNLRDAEAGAREQRS